jgi:superfamily II DNA/RNA helicase
VSREERLNVTAKLCGSADRSIVFVSTTHGADRLMEQLTAAGVECAAIHGRLSQNKRERVLSGFATGHIPVLIATNVAARGIHVDGVDLVVHYDPPEDTKVYLHRSGRTARAGNGGLVVTLALPEHEADIARLIQSVDEDQRIVAMDGDDPRLGDLATWQPPRAVGRVSGTYHIVTARPAARGGGGGGAKRKPARAVAAAAPRSGGGRAARSRSRRPW